MEQYADFYHKSFDAFEAIDDAIDKGDRVVSMAVGQDGTWIVVFERSES